jgi:long-subunit fatty acid transport protein
MRSVRPITNCKRAFFVLSFLFISIQILPAQENSPYSRYGLGDVLPTQNILNRSMGGLAIPYNDLQSVNFINPASYAYLRVTTLDVGLEYSSRTLQAENPPSKSNSKYLIPTYVQLGLPLKKKGFWGMNIGLRPVTRITYNLSTRTRLAGIDSVLYNYTGNGGTYQAYLGTGFGNRKFSFGINAGYMFGNKEYSTKVILLNDTVPYQKSNSSDTTRFGGIFVNAGALYRIELNRNTYLRLGANGSIQNKLNAYRDIHRATFDFSSNSGILVIDSVYAALEQKGKITYPASLGFGFMFEREDKWMFGAELNSTLWSDYRYYDQPDALRNSWTVRVGGQIIPDINSKSYWSRVVYRAGLSFGPDYIDVNKNLNQYLFSFGAGFPIRRTFYSNQYTTINTALEIGARGNKKNTVSENLFKISVGVNLSDIWFNPRKYD